MARIAVAGFQHETNTFAPTPATLEDFIKPDGWPGLTRGADLVAAVRGINLGMAGFLDAARVSGHEILPLLWCSASPSAPVTRDAYETISDEIVAGIKSIHGKIDAIYLDLHGAMVAAHLPDGEGELLRRIRAVVGPDLPIVVSLDLHANITSAMVALSDLLVPCLTYPHVDLAETGRRSLILLEKLLAREKLLIKQRRAAPFLIPLVWQCTMIDPMATLYRMLDAAMTPNIFHIAFAPGFPMADIAEAGPVMVVYGFDDEAASRLANHLEAELLQREAAFAGKIWAVNEAVSYARRQAEQAGRPIILADTEDNPGAGANSDMTGLLRGLLNQRAENTVVANIADLEVAKIAHQAGPGATINVALGEKSGFAIDGPLNAPFLVEAIGSGQFEATGPFYKGAKMNLGPMARLKLGGVQIVITGTKQQAADQAMLRHVGIEPAEAKILALKSSVHFRADFQPIAEEILIVAAGGPNPVDHHRLTYKNLRPGMRIMPRA